MIPPRNVCSTFSPLLLGVERDKRAYENSEGKGPCRTFHLCTFIGGIALIRFERLDLRMMKRRGCAGTALPLAGWNYWNLGGSAFIWVPVTKIILQGFRSLSAAQVQCRRQRLRAHTKCGTHRSVAMHICTPFVKSLVKLEKSIKESFGAQLIESILTNMCTEQCEGT